jgi:DNA-binding MarR family transcriptional regulator
MACGKMKRLLIKEIPKYACLCEAAESIPSLKPEAMEAYLHILRTSDWAYNATSKSLMKHGISKGGFMVMMNLFKPIQGDVDALTPGQLADLCGVKRATITGLVDTLAKENLVKREPDPINRRQVKIELSEEGERLMAQAVPDHFEIVKNIMNELTDSESRQLVVLLNKVTEGILRTEAKQAKVDPEVVEISL